MSVRHHRRPATPKPSSPSPPRFDAYIPVEDVAPLIQCCACSGAPLKTPATRCRDAGHLVCADCRRRPRTGSAGDASCPSCGSALADSGRDDALECVVRDLPAAACHRLQANRARGNGARRQASETSVGRNLMLDVEKLEEARRLAENADSLVSNAAANGRLTYSPLACPYPCGRLLTGSGLFPHFEFQHPRVPVAEINLGHPHPIRLDHRQLPPPQESGGRRCQALFLIHLDASGPPPQREDRHCHHDNTPRVSDQRPVLLRTTRSCHSMLVGRLFVAALQTGRLHDGGADAAMLAVWASALYELPDVTCTLTATAAADPPRSVSYTGPVSSMRAPQRPYDVFARGECLLVPPASLQTPLALTVAFQFHTHTLTGTRR